MSGCLAYNKTRQNVAPDTSDICQHRRSLCIPYSCHSSIRRDILSVTKNLAGLVPRIGKTRGFGRMTLTYRATWGSGKEEGGERRVQTDTAKWYRQPARNQLSSSFRETGEFRTFLRNRSNFAPAGTIELG